MFFALNVCGVLSLYLTGINRLPVKTPKVYCVLCCAQWLCHIQPLVTRPHGLQPTRLLCPWGFSRQEYWSGLPFPSPGDLPNPGIEPVFLVSPALAGRFLTTVPPEEPKVYRCYQFLFFSLNFSFVIVYMLKCFFL